MAIKKDVTILVNSCDKYEDAWEPFFKLLKIHWPECEDYRIILNTETKVYNCDFLNVETVCGGKNITWSKRLKNVLKKIDSEVVFFLMEDFFLKSRLDNEEFLSVVDFMKQNKTVGYVSVMYKKPKICKDGSLAKGRFVSRDELPITHRLALVSTLWNRNYLIKIIRNHETPWEFELYAGIRAKRYKNELLDVNNNEGYCKCIYNYDIAWETGIGITHGQWLPKNKELFDKYGIEVNFDNLGINYKLYEDAVNPPIPKAQVKPEKQQLDLREILYNIKKWPVKQVRKIPKTIRKIRSLV